MQARRKRFLLVLSIILGLAAVVFLMHRREPSYQGRSLSEWVAMYGGRHGRIPSDAEKEQPAEAIRQIGTNALPLLLTWLNYEPAGWRYRIGSISQKLPKWVSQSRPITWLLNTDEPGERAQSAMVAFRALGIVAKPAIPELMRRINLTNSPARRDRAMFALSSIGPGATPYMSLVLSNDDSAGNLWVMACIRNMGTNARPLVPLLVHRLQHTNWFAAMINARMLGELKFNPEIAVPALIGSLKDSRYEVRMVVPEALAEFGTLSQPALPTLSNAINDPNPDVRRNATEAIRKITTAATPKAETE